MDPTSEQAVTQHQYSFSGRVKGFDYSNSYKVEIAKVARLRFELKPKTTPPTEGSTVSVVAYLRRDGTLLQ